MDDLVQIVESARADFAAAQQNAALEDAKAKYIGKNGAITATRINTLTSIYIPSHGIKYAAAIAAGIIIKMIKSLII